jgi:hypothetical protein
MVVNNAQIGVRMCRYKIFCNSAITNMAAARKLHVMSDKSNMYSICSYVVKFVLVVHLKLPWRSVTIKLSQAARPRQVVERRTNQRFEYHLCSLHYSPDDENRDGTRNVGVLAFQPPDTSGQPGKILLLLGSLFTKKVK